MFVFYFLTESSDLSSWAKRKRLCQRVSANADKKPSTSGPRQRKVSNFIREVFLLDERSDGPARALSPCFLSSTETINEFKL
eukprot:g61856.t1